MGRERIRRPRGVCLAVVTLAMLAAAPPWGPPPLGAEPSAGASSATVPPVVEGWTREAEVRRFGPDALYEHINGASELYLSYGFRELLVAEYQDGRGGSLAVEVYRHASPADAFGIYSQERPRDGLYLAVGAEGYLEPPMLNLLNADAYVKLSADGLGERTEGELLRFAEAVVAALGGRGQPPSALGWFPQEGKRLHSEGFAAKDFLGYSFLRTGFTADYAVDEARFQLFIVDGGTPEASQGMLRRYRETAGASAAATDGTIVVPDPYNGEVALFAKGRYLCGSVRLEDGPLRARHLEALRLAVGQGLSSP